MSTGPERGPAAGPQSGRAGEGRALPLSMVALCVLVALLPILVHLLDSSRLASCLDDALLLRAECCSRTLALMLERSSIAAQAIPAMLADGHAATEPHLAAELLSAVESLGLVGAGVLVVGSEPDTVFALLSARHSGLSEADGPGQSAWIEAMASSASLPDPDGRRQGLTVGSVVASSHPFDMPTSGEWDLSAVIALDASGPSKRLAASGPSALPVAAAGSLVAAGACLLLVRLSRLGRRPGPAPDSVARAAPLDPDEHRDGGKSSLPEQIESLLESSTMVSLVVLDGEGAVRRASSPAESLLDTMLDDMEGDPLWSLACFGAGDRGRIRAGVESGEHCSLELSVLHGSGEEKLIALSMDPLDLSSGSTGCLVSMMDRTEVMEARREREDLEQKRLEASNAQVFRTIARSLASDLNNLLSGVVGAASLGEALHEGPESSDRQRYRAILNASERASVISDELLSLADHTRQSNRPLDLCQEIEEITETLRSVVPDNVSLDLALGSGLPPVLADKVVLRQMLFTLVLDSCKNMEGAGQITVSLEDVAEPASDIRFSSACRALHRVHCVSLSVSDTAEREGGHGPLRGSRPPGEPGAVAGLVRSLQGCMTSTSGWRGSVVRVLMPATERPRDDRDSRTARRTSGEGIAVLVAEKDEIVRETAREILEHYGFRVATAASLDEAAVIMEHERFEALVMDSVLTESGPAELVRLCRERWPWLSILFSSAFEAADDLVRSTGADSVGFLKK
ncbi:response regulator, partial [Candidatus Fermentibacterales bacterium]|nr:response regulator [Candidatus Fermentibacterales bacterium]